MATMHNKVAVCNKRYDELLNDPEWKEIVYNKMDINHDVLCVLYNPKNEEGSLELHDINAYIQRNMKSRVYFYINKDVDGIKNAFSVTSHIPTEDIRIEG